MIRLIEEIRLTSWYGKYPIISHYLQGFFYISGGCLGFLPSTVSRNHHCFLIILAWLSVPTSPRASQSMSFAEVGLKGRCAEGLFNAEHSTAECLCKCRWIYGRGICYTITLSHLRFFLHFTPGYTQELWAAMLENKIAVSKREQSWASVSNREQRWASMQCNIWIYDFFADFWSIRTYVYEFLLWMCTWISSSWSIHVLFRA